MTPFKGSSRSSHLEGVSDVEMRLHDVASKLEDVTERLLQKVKELQELNGKNDHER